MVLPKSEFVPTVGGLFSGVGGIELGFEQSGFEIAWANARCGARWRARIARRTLDDASARLAHIHHLIIQLDRVAAKASRALRICIAPSRAHRLNLDRWTRGVGRI